MTEHTTSAPFSVRRAYRADAERMVAIWKEAAEALVKADPRFKLAEDSPARWRDSLIGWLDRPEMAVYVAEKPDGPVIGYIVGQLAENLPGLLPERYGLVLDLAVDYHAKSSGIGRGLLEALKAWYSEQGASHLEARVPFHHPVAQAFWRALGATKLYDHMWMKLP